MWFKKSKESDVEKIQRELEKTLIYKVEEIRKLLYDNNGDVTFLANNLNNFKDNNYSGQYIIKEKQSNRVITEKHFNFGKNQKATCKFVYNDKEIPKSISKNEYGYQLHITFDIGFNRHVVKYEVFGISTEQKIALLKLILSYMDVIVNQIEKCQKSLIDSDYLQLSIKKLIGEDNVN